MGIRESKNIKGLLSTSSYSKQPSSLTSFCYLPRVREKTGSAELRTRRQTQFPIIWVGVSQGEVRVTELPALSAQLHPQDASFMPIWQVPSYLHHGLPASWPCHAIWAAVPGTVESYRSPRPRRPSGNCHWVREELAYSQGSMPRLKGDGPLFPQPSF